MVAYMLELNDLVDYTEMSYPELRCVWLQSEKTMWFVQ